MSKFVLSLFLLIAMALPGAAQDRDVQSVISDQIKALQADDFDQAFSYASPNIQMIFRNADNFGVMVRRGYPMVWRPSEVTFLEQDMVKGALWQKVLIRDAGGTAHILAYQMERNAEGIWKISGVQLLKDAGVAA